MYEHPQNVLLVKLINANLDLLAVHRDGGAEGASAGEPSLVIAVSFHLSLLRSAGSVSGPSVLPALHMDAAARLRLLCRHRGTAPARALSATASAVDLSPSQCRCLLAEDTTRA